MPRKVFRVCSSPESATFQSGMILRSRVCWESKVSGGTPTPGNRKSTDSRDTQGSTIRGATEFGEAVLQRSPGKATKDRLIAEAITATVIARSRWQTSWAYIIRRSAESSQPTKEQI
jgi:hypothetical protein